MLDEKSSEFAVDDLADACVALARGDAVESACVAHLRGLHKAAMSVSADRDFAKNDLDVEKQSFYASIRRTYAELLARRERAEAEEASKAQAAMEANKRVARAFVVLPAVQPAGEPRRSKRLA